MTMTMSKLRTYSIRIWLNVQGQDLVEYALMAGFVSVAAAGLLPSIVFPSMDMIFRKIESVMLAAVGRQ